MPGPLGGGGGGTLGQVDSHTHFVCRASDADVAHAVGRAGDPATGRPGEQGPIRPFGSKDTNRGRDREGQLPRGGSPVSTPHPASAVRKEGLDGGSPPGGVRPVTADAVCGRARHTPNRTGSVGPAVPTPGEGEEPAGPAWEVTLVFLECPLAGLFSEECLTASFHAPPPESGAKGLGFVLLLGKEKSLWCQKIFGFNTNKLFITANCGRVARWQGR